jgi:hypothetical protein
MECRSLAFVFPTEMVEKETRIGGVHLKPAHIASSADKHSVWKQKLLELEHIQDGLGKGLDPHIKETVAVLQLLGVHTQASCEGHLDLGLAAPWIDIQSPDLKLAELRRMYRELSDTADALEADDVAAEAAYDEMHVILKELERIEALEYKKLIPYLEEFYHRRIVSFEQRLMIDLRGRLSSQGALLQPAEEKETQALRLKEYQEEMCLFTQFLKNKFFS